MILAVKGFAPNLKATHGVSEFTYKPGLNVCEKSKAQSYGFHCAENPFDCLKFYKWDGINEFWAVSADGDIDESGDDSKISCTKMTLIRKIYEVEFLMLFVRYCMRHPNFLSSLPEEKTDGVFRVVVSKTPDYVPKRSLYSCFIKIDNDRCFESYKILKPIYGENENEEK